MVQDVGGGRRGGGGNEQEKESVGALTQARPEVPRRRVIVAAKIGGFGFPSREASLSGSLP